MRLNAQISTGVFLPRPAAFFLNPTNGCVNKWGVAITLKSNDQSFVFISQDTLPWLSIPTPQTFLFFFAFLLRWTSFLLVLDETEFTCPSQSEQRDLVKTEICRIRGRNCRRTRPKLEKAKLCCPRNILTSSIGQQINAYCAVSWATVKGLVCNDVEGIKEKKTE